MAEQLEQELDTDEACDPRIVAELTELACRQPALRTIDTIKGEERKRLAALAMQTINHHCQAEVKAKDANHGSIFANSALLWGRILWLLPTLVTRDSYESDQDLAKPPEPS